MKKFLFLLFTLVATAGFSQQVILLITDTIYAGDPAFDFTTGGVGSMTGNNKWVINNSYAGGSIYPATQPEDSVVPGFGTISHAPNSYYLHIYDNAGASTSGVSDCDWNPANASDRFVFLNNGFCSLGLTNVTFTFFWIAGGDSLSYGQLYYRVNGGPWTQTGRPKYNNQTDWRYEQVTSPAFDNAQNLQFGFRWVNPSEATSPNMSFGVDDIIAVGTYNDAVTNPVNITITSFSPDTVCENQYLFFNYALSAPLCDGQYEVEILNSNYQNVTGNSITNFTVYAPDTTGSVFMQLPTGLVGNCFHIVLVRASPQPTIIGDTSVCFSIIRCPTSIGTQSAPVMNDLDTTCVLSELDVYFSSTGTFNPNNTYYAQLSDSIGSFANPTVLGSLHSSLDYSFPPGDVSGLIPASVPPGCGYYIRVVSNSPTTIGSVIGPFCVKHCDEETNNIKDLHFCIGFPYPTDTEKFVIKINEWNNQESYDTCNNFTTELLDMMTFNVVNIGGIGVFHVNHSDTFQLIVGPPAALANAGIAPGAYYLRLLSSCSSSPTDTQGTVIRITIGEPNPAGETLQAFPDTVCFNVASDIFFSPYNPQSSYVWLSATFNNGLPSAIPPGYDGFGVIWPNGPAGFYEFRVRETNFGCPGPWSPPDSVLVISNPKAQISGPALTCFGDTAIFYATFSPATYWSWTTPPGSHIVALGNNERVLVFDSTGTYTIYDQASNLCGSDADSFTFTVATLLDVKLTAPSKLCYGDSVQLSAATPGAAHALLTIDSAFSGKPGAMFNLIAHDNLTIDSFACKLLTSAGQQVDINIYQKVGGYQGYELNSAVWPFITQSSLITTGIDQMATLPNWLGLTMAPGDTFGIYLTDVDSPAIDIAYSPPGQPAVVGTVYKSDGIIDYVQGSANNLAPGFQPFGSFIAPRVWNGIVYYHTAAGLHYIWNTGDTTPTINVSPKADSTYRVILYDNGGCNAHDSAYIVVNPVPTLSVGPDTVICDGLTYAIPGVTTGTSVVWMPATGLDNPAIATPNFKYNDSVNYTIIASDTTGCADTAHLNIGAFNCESYIVGSEAFSPNGDGTDDFYTLFANKIASYDIRIYNRWGELVYESSDLSILNDIHAGWDGTYKGKPQPVGTFVYYLTATDDYNNKISKKGNITLLR